jgi:hypothetical protein
MIDQLLEILPQVVTALTLVTAVFLTSLWLGMVLWTFRDIRSRSRDIIVQILATLMVGILTLPGLLVYFLTRPRETLSEAYEHALEQEALLQAIEEPDVCPGCGTKISAEFRYCPYCHTQLRKVCASCGKALDLDWNICPYCGTSQGSQIVEPVLDREIEPPPPLPEEIPPETV